MDHKKKAAAAMSAVMHYIKSEEEFAAMQAGIGIADDAQRAGRLAGPAAPVNAWGVNGRQTQMQLRNLMQFRSFSR
jgi:hypothetical protein